MIEVSLKQQSITEIECDVAVVNLFTGVTNPGGATGAVDAALGGLISQAIAQGDFTGKLGETTIFYTGGRLPARKVLVVGLGPAQRFDVRRVHEAAAGALRAARRSGARTIATIAHGAGVGGLDPALAAQFTADGSLHGAYKFEGYKSPAPQSKANVEQIILVENNPGNITAMAEGVRRGNIVGGAVRFARDLANQPANMLTPTQLAAAALDMARATGLECEILGVSELQKLGFGLLLAVSQGSVQPPACIILKHRGGGGEEWPLALVGKGVTFDAGGISIKPTADMWDMKFDMSGGAAVLGAMQAVARLQLPLNVLAVVPATENLPSGTAFKPGDVLRGVSGKSVEIRSTDAEGRLILADALAFAAGRGARRLLTASTLTGGARAALGELRFAVMANDEPWYEAVAAATVAAGERGWRLPSDEEYDELLRSEVADMLNGHGSRRDAHTVQGGMFLFRHVKNTPTVHIDIAATAYKKSGSEAGATGVVLRTMVAAAQGLT